MSISVVKRNGSVEPLDINKIHKVVEWACEGLDVSQSELETETHLMLFNGIKTSDIHEALIKAAGTLISVDKQDYNFVAARLLKQKVHKQITGGNVGYPAIEGYIREAVAEERLDPKLLTLFDFKALDEAIKPERDYLFTYLGLQTLVDRYFIRAKEVVGVESRILELPQHFWMRVAMGLAIKEDKPTERAIQFYEVMSTLRYVPSTPTLFNSGTNHSQMSSCYLNTVEDSIDGIFGTIHECANLSKYAGGIGTDWTRVRPAGDIIQGTNGKSSGVVPYLKIFNDTAVAVNQGGKRNGAFAAYLEPWHPDLYDFIDLKKDTGDERRRAHDIFPALWMNDLFFERKAAGGVWSFFSPHEFPELHELHGEAFKARYEQLERLGLYRSQVPAMDVWKRILGSLFETSHPWITFKDEMNRRNPQDHVGVIHNSNLCTEIALNTSDDETAVCNLGSVNMSRIGSKLELEHVVTIGMRMLDNVIDINFYPSEKARNANMRHRPVGMGVMGYAEWLAKNDIDFESQAHLEAADDLFELWSYFAIKASALLAKERGAYSSFAGSKWSRGILPIDTARNIGSKGKLDWDELRGMIKEHGMRNSNTMAIAPTATIANIAGTTPTIEPVYKRTYTKSNLSGSFLVVDPTLRYGKLELCKEAFEIAPTWVVKAGAIRQKWIDQAQSLNIFVTANISGRELAAIYDEAWELGCKTTYYLRSQVVEATAPVCKIMDNGCTSCQ